MCTVERYISGKCTYPEMYISGKMYIFQKCTFRGNVHKPDQNEEIIMTQPRGAAKHATMYIGQNVHFGQKCTFWAKCTFLPMYIRVQGLGESLCTAHVSAKHAEMYIKSSYVHSGHKCTSSGMYICSVH